MQLIKMERYNSWAAPKVITTFMNMRHGSWSLEGPVLTPLIPLSDNIFHITEHVLFQACQKGTLEETEKSEKIRVLESQLFLQQEGWFSLESWAKNEKIKMASIPREECEHLLNLDNVAWKSKSSRGPEFPENHWNVAHFSWFYTLPKFVSST